MKPFYVVDAIGEVVQAVSEAKLSYLQSIRPEIVQVNYLYDTPKRINEKLAAMTNDPTEGAKKFPLIALLQPIDENRGRNIGPDADLSLNLLICQYTNKETYSKQRYESTFKPVLYPLYLELLRQFSLAGRYFSAITANQFQHTKRDWPYSGYLDDKQIKQPFNDALDIIEIKNLKLYTKLTC